MSPSPTPTRTPSLRVVGPRTDIAFTLIELLVVIAVISVLAGLLLPTLGMSRETAQRTECAGNLRQVGISSLMYADEFRGCLPYSTSNLVSVALGETYHDPADKHFVTNFYFFLKPYLRSDAVWLCPAARIW